MGAATRQPSEQRSSALDFHSHHRIAPANRLANIFERRVLLLLPHHSSLLWTAYTVDIRYKSLFFRLLCGLLSDKAEKLIRFIEPETLASHAIITDVLLSDNHCPVMCREGERLCKREFKSNLCSDLEKKRSCPKLKQNSPPLLFVTARGIMVITSHDYMNFSIHR